MTTSETPIEPEAPSTMEPPASAASPPDADTDDDRDDRLGDGEGERADAPVARAAAPVARAVAPPRPRSLVRLIAAIAVTVIIAMGWLFVLAMHRFHVTVPVIVMSLGWAAVILSAYLLIRIGMAAAHDEDDHDAWWRPLGKRDELEREKRSLLKAIKEIEFDREMGKMTDADAAEIVRVYRAHAIEVIKALDHLETGGPKDVRDEIERELRARQAVASKPTKRKKEAKEVDKTRSAGLTRDEAMAKAKAKTKTEESAP